MLSSGYQLKCLDSCELLNPDRKELCVSFAVFSAKTANESNHIGHVRIRNSYCGSSTSERFIMLLRSRIPSNIVFSNSSVLTTLLHMMLAYLSKSDRSVE